jgi:hypothetical protein
MTTALTVNLAAQEQAAMHRTQLLLARCRGCRPPCAPMALEQAQWHAQQQADFLAWLDAGGFMQAYAEQHDRLAPVRRSEDGAAAPTPCAPVATALAAPAPSTQCTIENSGMTPLFSAP